MKKQIFADGQMWYYMEGVTTNPKGFARYNNRKSRFKEGYESRLFKIEH